MRIRRWSLEWRALLDDHLGQNFIREVSKSTCYRLLVKFRGKMILQEGMHCSVHGHSPKGYSSKEYSSNWRLGCASVTEVQFGYFQRVLFRRVLSNTFYPIELAFKRIAKWYSFATCIWPCSRPTCHLKGEVSYENIRFMRVFDLHTVEFIVVHWQWPSKHIPLKFSYWTDSVGSFEINKIVLSFSISFLLSDLFKFKRLIEKEIISMLQRKIQRWTFQLPIALAFKSRSPRLGLRESLKFGD